MSQLAANIKIVLRLHAQKEIHDLFASLIKLDSSLKTDPPFYHAVDLILLSQTLDQSVHTVCRECKMKIGAMIRKLGHEIFRFL